MSNYLNIHTIFSLASANPNRDDTGAPKTTTLGGVERAAISSQAMTRAKRVAFEESSAGEKSYRSTLLAPEIAKMAAQIVTDSGGTVDSAEERRLFKGALQQIAALTIEKTKAKSFVDGALEDYDREKAPTESDSDATAKGEESADDLAKSTLVWLAEREIVNAAVKLAQKTLDKQEIEGDASDFFPIRANTQSLSIAAFGRMFANRPELQNEASVQRADAFSTHEYLAEIDYFTAVDDLREHGAGHLGRKMKTSATYYWFCTLNRDELLKTWIMPENRFEARDQLVAFFHAIAEALPSGNSNTHAHKVLPLYVSAVPGLAPENAQDAFHEPIDGPRAVVEKLTKKLDNLAWFAPHLVTEAPIVAVCDREEMGMPEAVNLQSFAESCADWVLAGVPVAPEEVVVSPKIVLVPAEEALVEVDVVDNTDNVDGANENKLGAQS